MHPLIEWLAAAFIVVSAFFILVGALGLARLPDFFMRLHAPTKASTLGLGGVLIVSLMLGVVQGRAGIAELLIVLFVFITAPVSANLMAQAGLHLRLNSKAPMPKDILLKDGLLKDKPAKNTVAKPTTAKNASSTKQRR